MTATTLHEKLVEAAKEAGYVQKSSRNQAQGYSFAGDEAVTEKFREALLKQGVLCFPANIEIHDLREYQRQGKDVPNILVTLAGQFVVSDGTTELFVSGVGQGIDIGDKAIYKALTGLKKYVYRFLLMMATGDDPEKEEKPARTAAAKAAPAQAAPTTASKARRDEITALAEKLGVEKSELKVLKERVTDKATPAQFTDSDVDAMLKAVEEAGAAKAATGGEIV